MFEGSGFGFHSSFGTIGSASAVTSKITVPMSTPDMPSIIAWWLLMMIAKRSPSSSSIRNISQSGFERSSACEKSLEARIFNSRSPPGLGRAVWRRW